jgi:U3 small nucleolar RNA-associated protein 6
MADSVHYHLEKMVPELLDLKEREVFSQAEVKQIVLKRKDFEYKVHRRVRYTRLTQHQR